MTQALLTSSTQSVSLDAVPNAVFDYVSQLENLPVWSPEFANAVRRDGERCFISQRGKEVELRITADKNFGIVDFATLAPTGQWASVHSRVVANGSDSEYAFALFQFPGMPDSA